MRSALCAQGHGSPREGLPGWSRSRQSANRGRLWPWGEASLDACSGPAGLLCRGSSRPPRCAWSQGGTRGAFLATPVLQAGGRCPGLFNPSHGSVQTAGPGCSPCLPGQASQIHAWRSQGPSAAGRVQSLTDLEAACPSQAELLWPLIKSFYLDFKQTKAERRVGHGESVHWCWDVAPGPGANRWARAPRTHTWISQAGSGRNGPHPRSQRPPWLLRGTASPEGGGPADVGAQLPSRGEVRGALPPRPSTEPRVTRAAVGQPLFSEAHENPEQIWGRRKKAQNETTRGDGDQHKTSVR